MDNKVKKIVIPLATFVIVFILHLLYFKLISRECTDIAWFQEYIKGKEYFLGISYALSIAFMVFAFLKFKENRKNALRAALGGGFLAILLWFFCFLFGCCGSPMPVVYLNLIGLSTLRIPKLFLLVMTIIFIGLGYIWLVKKSPKNCCNGKPCK
ncbi:MAG: hypothetical protein Q8O30_09810 [Candidatus Omnitrophota bacterium]|nr:hypothetical protein [Candidatus Omnitrophota bacterium]